MPRLCVPRRHWVPRSARWPYASTATPRARSPARPSSPGRSAFCSTAPGRLFDLDENPALVACDEPDARVHGEFVRFADMGRALVRLDEIEGITGYDCDSLYERVLIAPDLCSGRLQLAWTYVMRCAPKSAAPIESGCWRGSRGRRQEFYRRLVAAHAKGELPELARRIADGYPWALDPDRERAVNCRPRPWSLAART